MSTRFEGRTVLVTGAGSGLGRAIAPAFAAEGAHVVAAGRTAATVHVSTTSKVAAAVLYLASADAASVVGTEVVVDGGGSA